MNEQNPSLMGLALVCLLALAAGTQAQSSDAPRTEIGAQFTSVTLNDQFGAASNTRAGFGGRVTYNLTDSVAIESQLDFFPDDREPLFAVSGNGYNGGQAVQGLFGVKAGKRFERFGVFGKARPGFIRFSRAVTGYDRRPIPAPLDPATPLIGGEFSTPRLGGRTEFATDIGGVIEFYPSRRIVTRFDLGDTIIRYGSRTVEVTTLEGTPPTGLTGVVRQFRQEAITTHNFGFSAGIGFRF